MTNPIISITPPDFLEKRPPQADQTFFQSWFKTVPIGSAKCQNCLKLPQTLEATTQNGDILTVNVTWDVTETPWTKKDETSPLTYDPNKQGIFTFTGTITDTQHPIAVTPQIHVENRYQNQTAYISRSAEKLDRGLVAVPISPATNLKGILVKWRLLATEYNTGTTFNLYKNNQKINTAPITTLNFIDETGNIGDEYMVEVVETAQKSRPAKAWATNYLDIPLQRPKDRPNPAIALGADPEDALPITYTANDLSVADVNGDGIYEILVKWYPSEAQDPGLKPRHTGETIFDLYTMEGQLLWRINLGINIVSSAHHSTFNFFDLNEDGTAELAIKTADGTRVYAPKADGTIDDLTDTPVATIGDPTACWVGMLQNPANGNKLNDTTLGRVARGPEYFTIFNGKTGMPIHTVDYFAPYRINAGRWQDERNNRADRFNGCVAYLPKHGEPQTPYPTVVEVRGHYGPHFVAAYQLIQGEIVKVWEYVHKEWDAGEFQGNHQISVADVDFDGFDEIIFGGIVLDQDGSILWSSNGTRGTIVAGHGDAMHLSVMTPDSDEFYLFSPRESRPPNNVTLFKASSGAPVWAYSADTKDVGRGVAANVTPLPGFEIWASCETPMYNIVSGQLITKESGGIGTFGKAPVNFRLYWSGDLLSEMLDGANQGPLSITKYNHATGELDMIATLEGTISNNGTKANPGLLADIFGDWREEIIVRTTDNDHLRIYTTDIPTDHVIYTLMHDPSYRLAICCQNSVYNQPPHLSFYLGEDVVDRVKQMALPVPKVWYT